MQGHLRLSKIHPAPREDGMSTAVNTALLAGAAVTSRSHRCAHASLAFSASNR
jgi:hypothetical protein